MENTELDPIETAFYGIESEIENADFLLTDSEGPDIPILHAPNLYEYNQNDMADKYTRGMCTGYGSIGGLSTCVDLFFDNPTLSEYLDIRYNLPDFDKENGGGFTKPAIEAAKNWWNTRNPQRKVRYFALPKEDPLVIEALEKGHRLVGGYYGNSTYTSDYRADNVLDNCTNWGKRTYGHVLTYAMTNGVIHVVDNYKGRTANGKGTNQYSIADFRELIKNANFHATLYLFLLDSYMTPSQLDRLKAKSLGIWSGEKGNDDCTRYECSVMIERTAKLLHFNAVDFWNGQRPTQPVTRGELNIMTSRVFGREEITTYLDRYATRGEVAEVMVRIWKGIQ